MRAALGLTLAGGMLSALRAPAGVREFRIDPGHSEVGFSIGFLGHPVRGRFDDVRGTIAYVAGNPAASSITVVIGANSVNTGSAHRDEHLRSPDFFDVARFPVIVFRSTRIAAAARGGIVASGTLTMHGITRPVDIPFRQTSPPIEDPHGSTLLYFSGAIRLARKDFGILGGSRYNDWFDALRSASMADSVDVGLDVSAWDTDFGRVHRFDAALERIAKEGIAPTVARIRGLQTLSADSARGAEHEIDQLARALLWRGRTANAITLLGASATVFARSASAQTSLARAHELAGDVTAARAVIARALAIDSLDTRALELRRRIGP